MSEQNTGFEKWWEDRIKNGLDAANRREYEDAWQAATAEANKRIAELEGEVAELKEVISVSADGFEQLQASNNTLREALENWQKLCLDNGRSSSELSIPSKALSITPVQD